MELTLKNYSTWNADGSSQLITWFLDWWRLHLPTALYFTARACASLLPINDQIMMGTFHFRGNVITAHSTEESRSHQFGSSLIELKNLCIERFGIWRGRWMKIPRYQSYRWKSSESVEYGVTIATRYVVDSSPGEGLIIFVLYMRMGDSRVHWRDQWS